MKRPCRCLIGEMPDEAELAKIIRDRIDTIPEEDRVPEEEYVARLAKCRECMHLQRGTCARCGCYVEIRAVRKWKQCPDMPSQWERKPELLEMETSREK